MGEAVRRLTEEGIVHVMLRAIRAYWRWNSRVADAIADNLDVVVTLTVCGIAVTLAATVIWPR
ncbi:hypothetical protein BG418_18805 [Streptomyces sp. CBMA152]|nr:hypothetical protein [Streptomyces sp. CBMA152]